MSFYERLKECRIKAGMTQTELSDALGIAKTTLSGYENGRSEPTIATISKLLSILDVDANYLYQDEMNDLFDAQKCTPEEFEKIIKKYRQLNAHGKEVVDMVLDAEWNNSVHGNIAMLKAAHERTDDDEMKENDISLFTKEDL